MIDATSLPESSVAETVAQPAVISLTDLAASKVRALLAQENNPALALRVYVAGGGCSGLSYGMTLDDAPLSDDIVVEHNGIKVLVDATSIKYVNGATIDYHEGLMESGFTVENPNAVSSCGCGHSFQTGEEGAESAHAGGGCGSGGGCACG